MPRPIPGGPTSKDRSQAQTSGQPTKADHSQGWYCRVHHGQPKPLILLYNFINASPGQQVRRPESTGFLTTKCVPLRAMSTIGTRQGTNQMSLHGLVLQGLPNISILRPD